MNVLNVLNHLDRWIKQRPGLDPADYGLAPGQTPDPKIRRDSLRAYNQEVRNIAKDRRRALDALEIARSLTPEPQLLQDAFRAYSGRLQWVDGKLDYTTGQYWPTEYRKAAACVLEQYIADWRRLEAARRPETFAYSTMSDVKAANVKTGGHWFDRSTMRFFNTRIESGLIAGKYFITSEYCHDGDPRLYTVRMAKPDGDIDTVGEFQAYKTKAAARAAIKAALDWTEVTA